MLSFPKPVRDSESPHPARWAPPRARRSSQGGRFPPTPWGGTCTVAGVQARKQLRLGEMPLQCRCPLFVIPAPTPPSRPVVKGEEDLYLRLLRAGSAAGAQSPAPSPPSPHLLSLPPPPAPPPPPSSEKGSPKCSGPGGGGGGSQASPPGGQRPPCTLGGGEGPGRTLGTVFGGPCMGRRAGLVTQVGGRERAERAVALRWELLPPAGGVAPICASIHSFIRY